MTIEQVIPSVLRHVNIARWGIRRAEMLALVAQLSAPGYLVEIDCDLLAAATGRTERQARYDHQVLVELAGPRYRVLHRRKGPSRKSDAWSINPISWWRNVPFLPGRATVLRLFCGPDSAEGVALMYKSAARRASLVTGEALKSGPPDEWLSANDLSLPPHHLASTPQSERSDSQRPVVTAAPTAPPSPYLLESEIHSLPDPSQEPKGSEGVSVDQDRGEELLAAVQKAAKTAIFGVSADRICNVAYAYPELVDQLIDFAGTLGWVVTSTGAAGVIEGQARALARPSPAAPAARAPHPADCHLCEGNEWVEGTDGRWSKCPGVKTTEKVG